MMREVYKKYTRGRIFYSYYGEVSQEMVERVVTEVRQRLLQEGVPPKVVYNMFSILVEGLQNMARYCYVRQGESPMGFVIVLREGEGFRVVLGNYIDTKSEERVTHQIRKANEMTKEELRERLSACRKANDLRRGCSAGLGLLEIVRRAEGEVRYELLGQTPKYSIFLLEITV